MDKIQTQQHINIFKLQICAIPNIRMFFHHVSDQLHLIITHRMRHDLRAYPKRSWSIIIRFFRYFGVQ